MPGAWDPKVYEERARQWRQAADELPEGETRNAYLRLVDGYEKLAAILRADRSHEPKVSGK